ncbi:MAG: prepilin-type N-terminal cleavage/methylation domain-containing protein [Candidatus Omnitrophica bacterium]|nr:prepilin-type N-terminal cleavage/methylation domain-containing protein [Candidatus Omnitrophota bacterium]
MNNNTDYKRSTGCLLVTRKGVSLVEVLVTVVLLSFIMGICYALLISGSDSWEINNVRVGLQQELRKGVDWITQDLRQAGSASITDVPADGTVHTSITFYKCAGASGGNLVWDSNTTRYFLSGSGGNQLQRQVGSQTASVIAQNVQSLQFSRSSTSPGVVNVTVQAQKAPPRGKNLSGNVPIQLSMSFKISLRN